MTLQIPIILTTCFSTVIALLIISIIIPSINYNYPSMALAPNNLQTRAILTSTITTTTLINYSFFISLIPTLIVLSNHLAISSSQWNWLSIDTFLLQINFRYDIYSVLFLSIALFITWAITEFSLYYMATDPNTPTFFRLLTTFLLAMIILTSANNFFQLLIGWEGVGFLSFLLIGWWFTRTEANTAALQAIIYNRIGDIGILLAIGYTLIITSSWTLDSLFITTLHLNSHVYPLLWGSLLAAMGNSAQFGLHPWLPAAMEGPTPVSALLHSSTMVVAGVFLLIRVSPLLPSHPVILQTIMIVGAITALFAASCAITQHDINNIVAFSTTSQLGLMIYAIGLNLPLLAFFHICTHGFFKAMLFLCSGSTIHNTANEQDLRNMGGLAFTIPTTSACLTLGSIALFGTPFLAGFYSKDLILESASASFTGLITLTMIIIATALTAVYSARIITALFSQNGTITPIIPISEEPTTLTNPLNRLAAGTTIAGWTLLPLLIPIETANPIPIQLNLLILIITVSGLLIAATIASVLNQTITPNHQNFLSPVQNFLTSFWYFPGTIHLTISILSLSTSQTLTSRIFDRGWGEQIGAQGIGNLSNTTTTYIQLTQSGLINQYLAIAILSTLLTILIIILLN
nr:NADH dehydrogenase subunit 5 [Yoda sp. d ASH-2021]